MERWGRQRCRWSTVRAPRTITDEVPVTRGERRRGPRGDEDVPPVPHGPPLVSRKG